MKEFIEFVYLKTFYEFFIAQQRVSGEEKVSYHGAEKSEKGKE